MSGLIYVKTSFGKELYINPTRIDTVEIVESKNNDYNWSYPVYIPVICINNNEYKCFEFITHSRATNWIADTFGIDGYQKKKVYDLSTFNQCYERFGGTNDNCIKIRLSPKGTKFDLYGFFKVFGNVSIDEYTKGDDTRYIIKYDRYKFCKHALGYLCSINTRTINGDSDDFFSDE